VSYGCRNEINNGYGEWKFAQNFIYKQYERPFIQEFCWKFRGPGFHAIFFLFFIAEHSVFILKNDKVVKWSIFRDVCIWENRILLEEIGIEYSPDEICSKFFIPRPNTNFTASLALFPLIKPSLYSYKDFLQTPITIFLKKKIRNSLSVLNQLFNLTSTLLFTSYHDKVLIFFFKSSIQDNFFLAECSLSNTWGEKLGLNLLCGPPPRSSDHVILELLSPNMNFVCFSKRMKMSTNNIIPSYN